MKTRFHLLRLSMPIIAALVLLAATPFAPALAPVLTAASRLDMPENPFDSPQTIREQTKQIAIRSVVTSIRKIVGYMFPTGRCPVGCDGCFFASQMGEKTPQNTLGSAGIAAYLKLVKSMEGTEITLAGGGEPFLEFPAVLRVIREIDCESLILITSGYWGKKPAMAKQYIDALYAALQDRARTGKKPIRLTVRLSVDHYHFERLGFDHAVNIMNVFLNDYWPQQADNSFAVMFRTVNDDSTVGTLLGMLPLNRVEHVHHRQSVDRQTYYLHKDGKSGAFALNVRHVDLFDADPSVDLHDAERVERNLTLFERKYGHKVGYKAAREDGTIVTGVLSINGEPHLNMHVEESGLVEIWGAVAPDNQGNLHRQDAAAILNQFFADPITIRLLENGWHDMDEIVSEVNPRAVRRARAILIADWYARIVLEEDRTRLYYSIRTLQNFRAEGRISEEEFAAWPPQVRYLVSLSRKELGNLYNASKRTIVDQQLDAFDGNDLTPLLRLYQRVQRGHYGITLGAMRRQILQTPRMSSEKKAAFLLEISPLHDRIRSAMNRRGRFFSITKANMFELVFAKIAQHDAVVLRDLAAHLGDPLKGIRTRTVRSGAGDAQNPGREILKAYTQWGDQFIRLLDAIDQDKITPAVLSSLLGEESPSPILLPQAPDSNDPAQELFKAA